MRRNRLASPRPVEAAPESASAGVVLGTPARTADHSGPPLRDRLAEPVPARHSLRRCFDPVAGKVRVLERRVSHFLARRVYPGLRGVARVYGRQLDRTLTVSEAVTRLPRLHPDLDGLRVLLVTDVHAGPFVHPAKLQDTLVRLQRLRPDLILLGGDLASSRLEDVTSASKALRALSAPAGVLAVLGNHDHYTGAPGALRAELERIGIHVLHNRRETVERGNGRMVVAGIDDLNVGRPDLEAALAGAPRDLPLVLLSHNPDVLFEASAKGVDLVLAGHTHGGQIRIPGLPVLVRMSRFRLDEGRYRHGATELVVSRGLGTVGLPLRVACPPEAVLLTLRSS